MFLTYLRRELRRRRRQALLGDEGTRDEIIAIIEGLWKERGLTVIMVTHDSVVARRAPKIAWISKGTLKLKVGRQSTVD